MTDKKQTIIAMYRHETGDAIYCVDFEAPYFRTSGKDCDTPKIEKMLMQHFIRREHRIAKDLNSITGFPVGAVPKPAGFLLAFYSLGRAKALIDRYNNPIKYGRHAAEGWKTREEIAESLWHAFDPVEG